MLETTYMIKTTRYVMDDELILRDHNFYKVDIAIFILELDSVSRKNPRIVMIHIKMYGHQVVTIINI